MVRTLRESKATLSELVELANRGEDVLITVRGKVKARLTRAVAPLEPENRSAWTRELRRFQESISAGTGATSPTVDEILEQDREDRF